MSTAGAMVVRPLIRPVLQAAQALRGWIRDVQSARWQRLGAAFLPGLQRQGRLSRARAARAVSGRCHDFEQSSARPLVSSTASASTCCLSASVGARRTTSSVLVLGEIVLALGRKLRVWTRRRSVGATRTDGQATQVQAVRAHFLGWETCL